MKTRGLCPRKPSCPRHRYSRILRNTHKISIWERIGVALRELFRDIGPKRERAITGARSQKRSALARLNPAQEAIPVRFLKFARHINRLTKSGIDY